MATQLSYLTLLKRHAKAYGPEMVVESAVDASMDEENLVSLILYVEELKDGEKKFSRRTPRQKKNAEAKARRQARRLLGTEETDASV
jgi:hypothetical protein